MLKENLWVQEHPVIRQLMEIPEIVPEEKTQIIQSRCISLKKLFSRTSMDEYHVDCLVLYQIALGVLRIMEELKQRNITPGLYDLGDFYVDLGAGNAVYLVHPERFQLLCYEQDYEWYPEDERTFGEITLFDEETQQMADTRLIYKILIASTKGNVRVPPGKCQADYSELFYRTLPEDWRQIFSETKGASHEEMRELLETCIAEEKASAREARDRLRNQVFQEKQQPEEETVEEQPETCNEKPSEAVYAMFVLLRTDLDHVGMISRSLYEEQDKLALEVTLSGQPCYQSFVFGNGVIWSKPFIAYPSDFRVQCEQTIREYSLSETMIIAAERMRAAMNECPEEKRSFRMYLIADGSLKNDRMFQCALERLRRLQMDGCQISFTTGKESRCEACQKLRDLVKEKRRQEVLR